MNREILFRGFHDDPTGDEVIFVDGKAVRGYWLYGGIREITANGTEFYYILKRETNTDFYCIPYTVGQYTGLKDKNGKSIFEGDIVEGVDFSAEDGYGVVQWADSAFEIVGHDVVGTFHENYYGKDFEVIGNIFENPEMLEATA